MNRRSFLSKMCGSLGLILLPKFAFANNSSIDNNLWTKCEYWEERNFIFEGTPATEYIWNSNYDVHFNLDNNKYLWVPFFDKSKTKKTLEDMFREHIQVHYEYFTGNNFKKCHLHFVRIKNNSNKIGILVYLKQLKIIIDKGSYDSYSSSGEAIGFYRKNRKKNV